MFDVQQRLGRLDEGLTGSGVENSEDESNILGDQDETASGARANSDDQAVGGMGSDEIGLTNGQFARGEIDVVEQMARTTRAADHVVHRDEETFPSLELPNAETPARKH